MKDEVFQAFSFKGLEEPSIFDFFLGGGGGVGG